MEEGMDREETVGRRESGQKKEPEGQGYDINAQRP